MKIFFNWTSIDCEIFNLLKRVGHIAHIDVRVGPNIDK
jgi:hypothetical protein